jgi:hypothetical protein
MYVVCVIRDRINEGNYLRPRMLDFLHRLVLVKKFVTFQPLALRILSGRIKKTMKPPVPGVLTGAVLYRTILVVIRVCEL